MNSHGHVAGFWMQCDVTADEAFYWTPETGFVTMPRPDGVWSARASDINDHGLVIGGHAISGLGWKAFVYDIKTGEYEYLEPKHDGVPGPTVSSANAINNAGIVAGSRLISKPDEPTVFNAVIWDTNTGEVTDLGVMNGPYSSASAISNDSYDTAGWTGTIFSGIAYRQENGNIQLVNDYFEFDNSFSHDFAEGGFVTGSGIPTGKTDSTGFVWVGDELILVDPLPGYMNCGSEAINLHGHAVGRCTPGNVPTLWQNGEINDLRDLVVEESSVLIEWPRAINTYGQILTRGKKNGKNIGVVLTPIGQPIGDLNNDCAVNIRDLLILISEWGKPDSHADLNGDGTVGVADLLILIGNWGG